MMCDLGNDNVLRGTPLEEWLAGQDGSDQAKDEAAKMFCGMSVHVDLVDRRSERWYAGITSQLNVRLFEPPEEGHGLRKDDPYVYRECSSQEVADLVERMLQRLGCQGHPNVPNSDADEARFVYVYLMADHTQP